MAEYGLHVVGANGQTMIDSTYTNLGFLRKGQFNCIGGYQQNSSNGQLGRMTTVNWFSDMIAVHSTQWVRFEGRDIRQLMGAAATTVTLVEFGGVPKVVYPSQYGLDVFNPAGTKVFSSTHAPMKIIYAASLPIGTQKWSYTAPAGRTVGIILGGGTDSVYYDDTDSYYASFVRIVGGNKVEVETQYYGWWWPDGPGGGRLEWDRVQNLNVIVVDLTEVMRLPNG